jgi:FkbM family methyltransferase
VRSAEERARRILFVSHTSEIEGGAGRSLIELAIRLATSGQAEPTVAVAREGGLAERLRRGGVAVVTGPVWPWTSASRPVGRSWPAAISVLAGRARVLPPLVELVDEVSPDVVVTNTTTVPWGAVTARLLGVPHVWFVRELPETLDRPQVAVPAPLVHHAIARLSDRVVVNSTAVAASLSPPVDPARVRVIAPGCEIASAPEPPPASSPDGPLELLMLGRLDGSKGSPLALEAMAIALAGGADLRLRIVGVEPEVGDAVRALVAGAGLGARVTVRGPTADVVAELDGAHVVLLPSELEGFGRVAVESLRRGRPVVGAAGGGTLDIVDDGETGLLFAPGDADELARILCTLADDRDLVARLAKQAWESARDRFDPVQQAAAFVQAVDEAIAVRPRGQDPHRRARTILKLVHPARRAVRVWRSTTSPRGRYRTQQRLEQTVRSQPALGRASDALAPALLGRGARLEPDSMTVVVDGLSVTAPRRFLLHFYAQPYEPLLLDWLQASVPRAGVAVDVGAHVGYLAMQMARLVGTTGSVIAVEPDERNVGFIRRNLAANHVGNVLLHALALADEAGSRTFEVNESSDSSSLFGHPNAPTVAVVEVAVSTLDSLAEGLNVDVLKIDAEGAEPEILAGARSLFERCPRLQVAVEWNPKLLARRGLAIDLLPQQLRALGHDVVVLDDLRGRVLEVDDALAELAADPALGARWYANLATRLP